jgi:leukotriene-A4 hydrolase
MLKTILLLSLLIPIQLMAIDLHSFAQPNDVVLKHLSLDLSVDFKSQKIDGIAKLSLERKSKANEVYLDTKALIINSVSDIDGNQLKYSLEKEVPFLGQALRIELNQSTTQILVNYQTTAESSALQWLSPAQTLGGKQGFLFTQGQAILSRTWIPVQDSPGIRFTWDAKVHVSNDLMAVMSGTNPTSKNASGIYSFKMDKPVPAYLIALAVGDLEYKELSPRTGVYAEPKMIERASYEFSDMDKMLVTAEKLYGKYLWDRYDVIVLPPSFPFGGMENPMLTFATPTIIAGDKSLTSLIAHELAHSWSGNLVTNQTWDDFWLNEGFTVYFERRIMEAIYGKEYAAMLAVLGYQDLMETIEDLGASSAETHLKLNLKGKDPDDGMNDVAYEKGCLLLLQIEKMKGREAFDKFLTEYFHHFAFQSIATEDFLKYIEKELSLSSNEMSIIRDWIYKPGIPKGITPPESKLFSAIDAELKRFNEENLAANKLEVNNWSTHEWLHFLRNIPDNTSLMRLNELDETFKFTNSGNSELRFAWFMKAIPLGYTNSDASLDEFLSQVGRRKFVLPLYKMMLKIPRLAVHARDLYKKTRESYHAVTVQSLDDLFNKN